MFFAITRHMALALACQAAQPPEKGDDETEKSRDKKAMGKQKE